MSKALLYLSILCFYLGGENCFAQQIVRGFVVDSSTQKPIEGAAVFFDKTTYGTITNKNGFFVLKSREQTKSPLIIRYLGYQPEKIIDPPQQKNVKFLLKKKEEGLEAVWINTKHQKKEKPKKLSDENEKYEALSLFKYFFLGTRFHIYDTKILNEDALDYYITEDKLQIIISAKEPLVIENEYLDYKITYFLEGFVLYRKMSEIVSKPVTDYYEYHGTALFKDLQKPGRIRKKFRRRRNEMYYGSRLHFMRALANNELENHGFKTFNIEADSINIQTITKEDFTEVLPPKESLVIHKIDMIHIKRTKNQDTIKHYIKSAASSIHAKRNFGIDKMGNFFPWNALIFEGRFGREGMARALPLDFNPYPN
ncbi:carboxypeptidase-like regulatory domain-containing protein [Mesonia ostreae]|uniref:Carboxypeptidase-like regulatory domain-containing protein n=1 Tax=Mesonia ostreae TaxID=861110 RepID=A0ABU2KJB9_9FLAO|nr:carboxypeptidase-like regulatory domain-containing protein [Mesonia ostreae]MDT0294815.1 carboxypeptidase-like regulatory domain-containing protein [Mesonia ostreae]